MAEHPASYKGKPPRVVDDSLGWTHWLVLGLFVLSIVALFTLHHLGLLPDWMERRF